MNAYEYFTAINSARVDQKDKLNPSWNALHICIAADDLTVIPALIEQGADINLQDSFGRTPLHLAVGLNRPDACSLLLNAGAATHLRDNTGHTADQRAEIAGFWHVLDAFRPSLGREALNIIASSIDNGTRQTLAYRAV